MPKPRFASLAAAILLFWPAPATQQKPGFRSGISTVEIYATVVDRDGRLVPDLPRDDFEVRDNGVRQAVTVFSNQILPFSAVLMLDTSVSMRENFDLVRKAGTEFVNLFVRGDRANIGTFAGEPRIGGRFFANCDRLVDAVAHAFVRGGNLPCLTPTMMEKKTTLGASRVWDAIECGILTLLTDDEAIRRVVLVITDGRDHGSAAREDTVVRLAGTEGVMVYVIALFGHEGIARRSLQQVARETGGGFLVLTEKDDLGATLRRLVEELHRQYILGFTPRGADGGKHKLTVDLKRPGLTVRARQTYDIQPVK